MVRALPRPLADTSSAAALAPSPRLRPYSGRMAVSPLSKKPPMKPTAMISGCARSACHTPRQPTGAEVASPARGRGGISRLQAKPQAMKPSDSQTALSLAAPTAASMTGPMTKVAPTMVSKMPT